MTTMRLIESDEEQPICKLAEKQLSIWPPVVLSLFLKKIKLLINLLP